MTDIDPKAAVDLGKVKENAEAREKALAEAEARARFAEAQETADRWDRGMRRVFKGIMPAKDRHRFLFAASRANE